MEKRPPEPVPAGVHGKLYVAIRYRIIPPLELADEAEICPATIYKFGKRCVQPSGNIANLAYEALRRILTMRPTEAKVYQKILEVYGFEN